jgi:hypothetical protein
MEFQFRLVDAPKSPKAVSEDLILHLGERVKSERHHVNKLYDAIECVYITGEL